MRAIALFLGLSACVIVPIPVPTSVGEQSQVRSLRASTAPDAGFHARLNGARTTPIAYNAQLAAVARAHAQDTQARGYFDHKSPEGLRAGDRAAAVGIPACGIGENIAKGQKDSAEVFEAWMSSGGHRRNMENPRMASYGLGQSGDAWVLMLYTPC